MVKKREKKGKNRKVKEDPHLSKILRQMVEGKKGEKAPKVYVSEKAMTR